MSHRTPRQVGVAACLAATLLAAPVGAQAGPARQPPATCQGEPATIVSNEWQVVGTAGRDVVVAGTSSAVRTLAGDDLVCIVRMGNGSNHYTVDAGEGDDVVDTTGAPEDNPGSIRLGAGSDRFVGGPAGDSVHADGEASAEVDHVATGSGNDSVSTGTAGHPNGDTVLLGEGDDGVAVSGTQLTGPPLDGGPGDNRFTIDDPAGAYAVDNSTQAATRDGRPWARWSGFDDFRLWESPDGFTFVGSDRDEAVTFYADHDGAPRSIDLAGGDDGLYVYSVTEPGEDFRGGEGRDYLVLGSTGGSLALDLGSGALHLDRRASGAAEGTATGFEGAHAMARRVSLRGTRAADDLTVTGCRLVVDGRGGPDRITRFIDWLFEEHPIGGCRTQRATFRGGPGRDDIRGSLGNDRLLGGKGRDKVDGWSGRDLCRAEKVKRCER